jgi:hypothetical protein
MAGQDQPVNALLNITTLLPTDIIYVGRVTLGAAGDCYMNAVDLIASLSTKPVIHAFCAYNQSTNILLASAALISSGKIKSIALHCYFERNGQSRSEIVTLSYTAGDSSIGESPINTVPESILDLGISLSANNSAGLNLVVTCNAQPVNVDMYYNVLSVISI